MKIIENKNNSTTFLKKFGSKNVEDISVELMGFNGHYGDVTGTGESANQTKKKTNTMTMVLFPKKVLWLISVLKKTEIFWLDSFLAYNSPLIPPQPPLFRSFISTFSYVVVFVCLGFSSLVVITCFLLYAFLCFSSHCRSRKEKWKTLGKCFRFFLKYVYVDREKNGESLIFWQSKK